MSSLSVEALKIRNQGWRQGAFIKIESPVEVSNQRGIVSSGDYLLISQDCDIQTPSLMVEPFVEIVKCKRIEKIDGNCESAKNSRKLHFNVRNNGKKVYFECEAKNKFYLDRSNLIGMLPNDEFLLEEKSTKCIRQWLRKRYDRDAFPDGFNASYDRKSIRKILKNSHEKILYVCVRLNSQKEFSLEDLYEMELYFLVYDFAETIKN